MDMNNPASKNFQSTINLLKRKLNNSRLANERKLASGNAFKTHHQDRKGKLANLAGKIKSAQQDSNRLPSQQVFQRDKSKPVKLKIVR